MTSSINSPSILLESGAGTSDSLPLPVWTLRIPMTSTICVNILLQIANTALASPDGSRNRQQIDNPEYTVLLIAQLIVNVLAIVIFSFFIYPNNFISKLTGMHHVNMTQAGATKLYTGRILIVATLALVYLCFVAHGIYDLTIHGSELGYMAWIVLVINISMVLMMAFDCRIQWKHKMVIEQRIEHAQRQSPPPQNGEHSMTTLQESRSSMWSSPLQEDLPPYDMRRSMGTPVHVYGAQAEQYPRTNDAARISLRTDQTLSLPPSYTQ